MKTLKICYSCTRNIFEIINTYNNEIIRKYYDEMNDSNNNNNNNNSNNNNNNDNNSNNTRKWLQL